MDFVNFPQTLKLLENERFICKRLHKFLKKGFWYSSRILAFARRAEEEPPWLPGGGIAYT